MTGDVGQCFLHDAEYDDLDVRRQPLEFVVKKRDIQPRLFSYAGELPFQGLDESEFIEHLGTQINGKLPDPTHQIIHDLDDLAQLLGILVGQLFDAGVQHGFHAGEMLADFIVQFSGKETAFFFLNVENTTRELTRASFTSMNRLARFRVTASERPISLPIFSSS